MKNLYYIVNMIFISYMYCKRMKRDKYMYSCKVVKAKEKFVVDFTLFKINNF